MRGVSPVVATILMVAIAIAAAVVAYSWFSSVQASLQSQAGEQAESLSNVRFEIVSAECNSTDNSYNVYIHNLSSADLNTDVTVIVRDASGAVVGTGRKTNVFVKANEVDKVPISPTEAGTACNSGYTIELRVGTFVASAKVK